MNIVDFDAVVAAYEAVVSSAQADWLLLKYADPNQLDDLSLCAVGKGNVAELREQITNLNDVYLCFCRDLHTGPEDYLLINYVPPSVPAIRRARVLVHSRRMGQGATALFKVDHTTLTIDSIEELIPSIVQTSPITFETPSNSHIPPKSRVIPTPAYSIPEPAKSKSSILPRSPPVPSQHSKASSLFSSFLHRRGRKSLDDGQASFVDDDTPPPPPPPKDNILLRRRAVTNPPPPQKLPSRSPENFTDISQGSDSDEEPVIVSRFVSQPRIPTSGSHFIIPVDRKWSNESKLIPDAQERARRRREAQEAKIQEQERALQEEQDRQLRLKLKREEQAKQEARAEAARKAETEREIKRITNERRRKAKLEEEQEREKQRVLVEQKEADRQRRYEEHLQLNKWRARQAQLAEETEKRELESQRLAKEERERRTAEMKFTVAKHIKEEDMITGWLNIQASDSLIWRRRFYKLVGTTLFLYRSPKDMDHSLDQLNLKELTATKEWNEGYEELKALPYAFAIEFHKNPELTNWSIYQDTEDEKDKLLGLLHYAAGL